MPGLVKHRLAALARKMAPHLLGGETEDGREPAHHALGDVEHDGLRRAARGARGGRRVHAVLEDVEVEAAQIDAAEVVDRKSTRLNSSHVEISYAVFCLKKKKKKNENIIQQKNHQKVHKRVSHTLKNMRIILFSVISYKINPHPLNKTLQRC